MSLVVQAPAESSFELGDWDVLARRWHVVAFDRDVDAQPAKVRLLGLDLAIYRTENGEVVVARDLCVHRGTPLTLGRVEGEEIVCAYHGWRYAPDGRCTLIPSRGPEHSVPRRARLAVLRSCVRYGLVWASFADEPEGNLPEWPEAEDPSFRKVLPDIQEWATSAGRQIENFLDVSHFSFVHTGTFGNPDWAYVPDLDIEPTPVGLRQRYRYIASSPDGSPLAQSGEGTVDREMVYELTLPFSGRLAISYPDGRADVVCLSASPSEARRVRIFFFVARNYDHDRPAADFLKWDYAILEEDRVIVEEQRPEDLPIDLSEELHVRADKMAVAYRRALRSLGLGRRFTA